MSEKGAVQVRELEKGDWGRRLHGPFSVLIQNIRTGHAKWSDSSPYAEALIRPMIEERGFPVSNRRMALVDVDGWIVFGYSTDPGHLATFGQPSWWGSEFGFYLLEATNLLDPVELAMMEASARDLSDGDRWWG